MRFKGSADAVGSATHPPFRCRTPRQAELLIPEALEAQVMDYLDSWLEDNVSGFDQIRREFQGELNDGESLYVGMSLARGVS